MSPIRFTHVLNPYRTQEGTPEARAHQLTFESLEVARRLAGFEVEQVSVQFPEDRVPLPEGWSPLPHLDRSILDLRPLSPPRRYPLLQDIVERAGAFGRGEFLIYSNTDICVQPHFYLTVDALIRTGLDAMVINRRWFDSESTSLPLLYSQVGHPHRGYDCFVFRRPLVRHLDLGELCLGIPWVGLGFFLNLRERGGRFAEFTDLHVTFHLGRDQPWADPRWRAYREHNFRELAGIRQRLEADGLSPSHPWLEPAPGWMAWKQKVVKRWDRMTQFFS